MNEIKQDVLKEAIEVSSNDILDLAERFDKIDSKIDKIKGLLDNNIKVNEAPKIEGINNIQEEIEILEV
jgi:hypothetical protein